MFAKASAAWMLLGGVLAQQSSQTYLVPEDPDAKAAYFVNDGYVFALNAVVDGDVYFHMNAPATHSWMGVGFGPSMKDSFMLISYPAENGHNLTTSARIAYGHSEPVHQEGVVIEGIYNDAYAPFANTISPHGVMIAHAVCRNCSRWATGSIDTQSTAQPFIFALGPQQRLRSNALNAGLDLHVYHGSFTLDMTRATNTTGSYGRVPAPQNSPAPTDLDIGFISEGSSPLYDADTDQNWSAPLHAAMMCAALVLVFPVGALLMRITKRVRLHLMTQLVGSGMIFIGFGVAVYMSRLYTNTMNYNSAHQLVGIFVFALLFIQLGLGLMQHTIYRRYQRSSIFGQIHRYLGAAFIVLGVLNGGLGFNLARNSHYNIPYAIIVAILALMYFSIFVFWRLRIRGSRKVYEPDNQPVDLAWYPDQPQIPEEYSMNESTYSPNTPRTPRSASSKHTWSAVPYSAGFGDGDLANGELWVDTPATTGSMHKGRWESVPLR